MPLHTVPIHIQCTEMKLLIHLLAHLVKCIRVENLEMESWCNHILALGVEDLLPPLAYKLWLGLQENLQTIVVYAVMSNILTVL